MEYVGLSFVRRADDVAALRALLPAGVRIVAKIEKDTALDDLDAIAHASDAVMVARGDLGVELPFELVPLAQKRVIRVAVKNRRPVITATQMLESMVRSPRPTRAEASDVANAILDGTDAVMLSEETAIGAYPREAVEAMDRIIRAVEGDAGWQPSPEWLVRVPEAPARSEHAVAAAAVAAARMLGAPLIVTFTKSGFSARMVAANRPPGADPRRDGQRGHLPGARAGVGRGADAGRRATALRRDAGRRARADPGRRPGQDAATGWW